MQITRLKYERLKKGWTQQELAEQIGITKSAIQRIETMQRKPSYNVLIQLRNIFNLHDADLFQQVNDEDSFSSTN